MFLGHYAVAFAAKKTSPPIPLGALVLAAQLADLVWPMFLVAGIEHVRIDPGNTAFTPLDFYHYPWTHSLLMALLWSAASFGAYFALTKQRRDSAIIGIVVFSHWVLDFITHRPDLPLLPLGGTKVGLGLWNSVPMTLIFEVTFWVLAIAWYLRTTRAKNRVGHLGLWSLIVFLSMVYVANLLGPPPPSAEAIAPVSLTLWFIPLWAWWADYNREVVSR